MRESELVAHYDFYVDNCTEGEIPLSYHIWKIEYHQSLLLI